ncbi:hypothetical protein, partial [Parasediminibacterium sp. JCM 36343]|uniref:hypothetical protein n=1 Tax=Parasediminibacterium sp. JCM 36343 TaxID=3374279 RepID=UPI003978BD8F
QGIACRQGHSGGSARNRSPMIAILLNDLSHSQIYNVTLELKPNSKEKDEVYSVTPCLRQYQC